MQSGKVPCTRQAFCWNQVLGCNPVAEEFSHVTARPVVEVGGKAGLADADVGEFVHQTEVLRRDEVRAVDEDHRCVLVYEREAEKLFGVQLPGRVVAHDAVHGHKHTGGFDGVNELASRFAPRRRVSGPVGCQINLVANDPGSFPDRTVGVETPDQTARECPQPDQLLMQPVLSPLHAGNRVQQFDAGTAVLIGAPQSEVRDRDPILGRVPKKQVSERRMGFVGQLANLDRADLAFLFPTLQGADLDTNLGGQFTRLQPGAQTRPNQHRRFQGELRLGLGHRELP